MVINDSAPGRATKSGAISPHSKPERQRALRAATIERECGFQRGFHFGAQLGRPEHFHVLAPLQHGVPGVGKMVQAQRQLDATVGTVGERLRGMPTRFPGVEGGMRVEREPDLMVLVPGEATERAAQELLRVEIRRRIEGGPGRRELAYPSGRASSRCRA
jgi:hypothetical protein